jgi:acetyl-CoA acetyltransferase
MNAVIVAAEITRVGVYPDETAVELAARALTSALDRTGLARPEIDGLVWSLGRPSGEDYPTTVDALGLNLRFASQFWTHGRWTGAAVMTAAMAVSTGAADIVACLGGVKRVPDITGPDVPLDPTSPAFAWSIHQAAGMAFRRYLTLYRCDRDRVADVVIAQRQFAQNNERAYLRAPLTLDEYMIAPEVIDPFRLPDCYPFNARGGPMNDYGVCLLVARPEVAASLAGASVHILAAQGLQASREEIWFGRPGLGLLQQSSSSFEPTKRDMRVYADAGIVPADIDAFYTYDVFSSLVWMALERFGHCEPGAAHKWATIDRIGPGGQLPVNTNGGNLSEGHTAGWGHFVEMVRQLSHEAGPRQVPNAELVQWGSTFGDSVVLTNSPRRGNTR